MSYVTFHVLWNVIMRMGGQQCGWHIGQGDQQMCTRIQYADGHNHINLVRVDPPDVIRGSGRFIAYIHTYIQ